MIRHLLKGLLAAVVLGSCLPAQAQVWPGIFLEPRLAGLNSPVVVTHAGDGSGRLFIVEQRGVIRISQQGALRAAPFLDISGKVLFSGEEGLLGLAFPPNYAGVGHFYVYYTTLSGDNVVARYGLSADPNQAAAGSEQIILTLPHPIYTNHNGGQLAFGPQDGYLYLGPGDGGGTGDFFNNAQNTQALLGKILRLDVESPPDPGSTYKIPPSNPYVGVNGYRPEIWALGLRNPWRFSFDRLTHDLYIGDVGQDRYEEVDFQPAGSPGGENYGWNILEGPACYNPLQDCPIPAEYAPPVMYYDHSEGNAIVGGYVYRGATFPLMQGVYFFADYLSGRIWGLQRVAGAWQRQLLLSTGLIISSFGEDEVGNLYLADYTGGRVLEVKGLQAKTGALLLLLGD